MGLLGSASERWLSQVSGLPTLIWTQGCNHSYWGKSLKPKASRNVNPIWILLDPYLIFVISFTLAGFLNPNILHPKITKNTQKLHEIAPKSVTYAVFRFESGNFYTGQNFFTQAPPVVPVTNMRYGKHWEWYGSYQVWLSLTLEEDLPSFERGLASFQ